MLNIIINVLRPCKIKSRNKTFGIKDQIQETVKIALEPSVWRPTGRRSTIEIRPTDLKFLDKFTPPAERFRKVPEASFCLRVGRRCTADRRERKRAKLSIDFRRLFTEADRRTALDRPTDDRRADRRTSTDLKNLFWFLSLETWVLIASLPSRLQHIKAQI